VNAYFSAIISDRCRGRRSDMATLNLLHDCCCLDHQAVHIGQRLIIDRKNAQNCVTGCKYSCYCLVSRPVFHSSTVWEKTEPLQPSLNSDIPSSVNAFILATTARRSVRYIYLDQYPFIYRRSALGIYINPILREIVGIGHR
jgi:hypothetical protein